MNILVINGSPKGENSITVHTVTYLEKIFTSHSFSYLNVGQTIKSIERDFSNAEAMLSSADFLLFSYPVYTFIAPSQLHRFIELIKESGVDISGKYATQITTSKHFYDVTAHKYIEENCLDMGLRYIKGLSADMNDLLTKKGREEAEQFFYYIEHCVRNNIYAKAKAPASHFVPSVPTELNGEYMPKNRKYDTVIITDSTDDDSNVSKMIRNFRSVYPFATRVINISDYPFSGGCLGCFMCAVSGKCVYKDGFDEFLRQEIQTASAIVYAFEIRDHSMGSRFKMYDDRNFCNGHRTVTVGTPVGYLVSGRYSEESNLRMIIEGRSSVGGNFLAGVATDEVDADREIDELSKNLVFALRNKYTVPQDFFGVGGMKIFRDLIFEMRGMMRADHKFYKKHKQYDFPQKKFLSSLKMYLVGMLLGNEKIRNKVGPQMKEGMIAPYRKMLEKMDEQKK